MARLGTSQAGGVKNSFVVNQRGTFFLLEIFVLNHYSNGIANKMGI